ncbi:hypothetical protein [Tabrizicola sp.]|uniref:hypothetical protein n=1 Tax=Tabrizicola sp. TaxID=2005166 RepID=UPI002FDF015C
MLEYLAPGFLYSVGKDVVGFFRRKKRFPPELKIERRDRWKTKFEDEIRTNFHEKLRTDIIIRDVARYDQYPNSPEQKRGISPWFRLALLDTYHDGILVWLRWDRLIHTGPDTFRNADWSAEEEEGIKVVLAGKIPFYLIENVDFEGDEYYCYPHIFCHFAIRKMPYESLDYYREIERDGFPPFYTLVASQADVNVENRTHARKK